MKKLSTQLLTLFLFIFQFFAAAQSRACDATWGHYHGNNPDSIHFYANTTSALGYLWTFGDSTTSTSQYPWHNFTGAGTYTVCLTVFTSVDTCTHCDTIVAPGTCNATWTNYNNSNNPDSVHLLATESGALSYYWMFGDSTTGSGQYPWHVYPGPGTYNCCLVVHDSSGYCTWCDTVIVPSATPCNAAWVHYHGTNTDSIHFAPSYPTGVLGFYWTFGDSSGSTAQWPWHYYTNPGTYTVCLTVFTSTDTCTHCDTVVIAAPNHCNATFVHYQLGNNPDSIHFYPYTTNGIGYFWNFGDSTGWFSVLNPTHVFPGPGTYNVCLTVHDPVNGYCTWCDTVIIPASNPCNATWGNYNLASNPDSVHFYANESGALGYYWMFGDSTTGTGQYPWHVFPGPGTYNVCLVVHDANGYCTWCDTVIVPAPTGCTASFTYYSIGTDSIRFHASPTTASGYYWNWGDNTTLSTTASNPEHTFPGPGIYYVCLYVFTSTDTCTHCDTVTVAGSTAPCNAQWNYYHMNDSIHFYPTGNGNNGWMWTFGDGDTSYLPYPWHDYASPGIYTVCLTVHDTISNTYCTSCDTVIIAGTPPCNAAFVHYQLGSNPDSIHFYPYSTSALGYYWSFGDNTFSTTLNPTHVYPGPGNYIACLTVFTSNDTCTWCDSVVITGTPPCNSQFSFYTISNPDSIHFYPTSSGAIAWHWTFGDGDTSNLQYPWHYYASSGTYYVCLTSYYSTGSCTSCDTVTVGNTSCNTHFAHYTLNNPDSLHFYPTGSSAISYHWNFGDGDTSNLQYPWHQYANPGTYTVCLTAQYSTYSCTWCDTVVITGSTSCNAEFSWYFMSNADSLHFYPLTTGATGYYWNFGDSTTSTLQYPWHVFPGPGVYTVCLIAHFSNSYCTWCDTVTVGSTNLFYQIADNPLLDRFVFEGPVFVPELNTQIGDVLIFPNPANEYVTVSLYNIQTADLRIYDARGREVLVKNNLQSASRINISEFAAGLYFLKVQSGNAVFTRKLFKE